MTALTWSVEAKDAYRMKPLQTQLDESLGNGPGILCAHTGQYCITIFNGNLTQQHKLLKLRKCSRFIAFI